MGIFLRLSLETRLDIRVLIFPHLSKFNSASSYLHPGLKKGLESTSLDIV